MLMFGASSAEIAWYFGAGENLLGGASCMGPILDHAALYHVSREERCRVPRSEVTAWPMHNHRQNEGYEPDDTALRRFGRISRKLRDAAVRMPEAPRLLAAYHGPEGDRWGRSKHGRVASLVRFTTAGAELIRKARKKERGANLKITDAQRIENSAATVAVDSGQLMKQGLRQAEELYERAMRAYLNKETLCAQAAE